MLISELPFPCDGSLDGRSVCITGNVISVDPREDLVTLQHEGASIVVSTALLGSGTDETQCMAIDCSFQFIGEMKEAKVERAGIVGWHRTLIARVVSKVNGLNMKLHEQALRAQRDFLKKWE